MFTFVINYTFYSSKDMWMQIVFPIAVKQGIQFHF